MKIVIAQMKHETNTYSPVPTGLARFALGGELPPVGQEAYQAYKGTGSAIGAFIDLAEGAGAQIEIPIAASAWPSGPVHDSAFEYIAQRICDAVAQGCDAVLLDLHSAAAGAEPAESRQRADCRRSGLLGLGRLATHSHPPGRR